MGRDYLMSLGIPESAIIAETQSRNTEEQAHRIAVIARTNSLRRLVVVSDGTHLFRIHEICAADGLDVLTSPGRASPSEAAPRNPSALRTRSSATLPGGCICICICIWIETGIREHGIRFGERGGQVDLGLISMKTPVLWARRVRCSLRMAASAQYLRPSCLTTRPSIRMGVQEGTGRR